MLDARFEDRLLDINRLLGMQGVSVLGDGDVRAGPERSDPIRTTAIGLAIALVVTLSASVAAEPIRIMTFNVENLFDTKHDEGKNDETYLPLAAKQNDAHRGKCARISVERWRDQCLFWDWNERVLDRRLLGRCRCDQASR